MRCTLSLVVFGWLAGTSLAFSAAGGADYEPGTPSVYLFDTAAAAAEPLPAARLDPKSAWTAVPEDNLAHQFRGDAVILNDRLTVVLRWKSGGGEVYSQTPAGLKHRVTLAPAAGSGAEAAALGRLQILENSPAAVMIAATFQVAQGGACALKYRLTAGQAMLEVRPDEGTDRLLVRGETRYAVVPDFFGDDAVFPIHAMTRPRLRLPAENFFLSLLDRGSAQVMCVWQSSKQEAAAVGSTQGRPSRMPGYEIGAAKDKKIWVAVLEGNALWHERVVSAEDAKAQVTLAWKPPFPAKWRADLIGSEGAARSWYFRNREEPGEASLLPGEPSGPCCLEAGRALVRLHQDGVASPAWPFPGTILVYAIDRSRATPLATYCPIDVLRNTLGVGPCQYILQSEGLASESNPTPDNVMTWVEKQFQRKKQEQARDEIREMLDQMVAHVRHVQARIDRYAGLAADVCKISRADAQSQVAAGEALGRIAGRLDRAAKTASTTPTPPERAGRLAQQLVALIGKADPLADCQRLGAEIRAVGAVQDRALSNCRMTVRWLKQSAAMIAEDNPAAAELAKKIQGRAEQVLQTR